MTKTLSRLIAALLGITLLGTTSIATAAPQTGQAAPAFSLQASDGSTYQLSDFIGKSGVVIAFFPKAFTGG